MRRGGEHHKLWGILWFITVLVFVSAMLAAAFYLTAAIYRVAHLNPPPLLAQIVNTLLGLFFTGSIIGITTNIARAKGWMPERNIFEPIIGALEQIAKGDFNVRLDNRFKDNPLASDLATSFNNMADELSQMEKMRQEFISNVSHEIQSPLTSIRGFARALQNNHLEPDERRHYLNVIETESVRLSRVTENLLRLASLDSEGARFEPKPYRLDKQIRDLVLASEPQWTDKGIEMDVSLEEVSITADEDLLSQVWNNLIHNSIKFTPSGGRVCLDLRQQDGHVDFKITDTGIGIAEEDRLHVFERFFKADRSRQRAGGGSGLGLSIAQKIVDMHKGEIGVESKPGEGTTFNVSLPIQP